mmetsp:Transcript_5011/g.7431  ORF Transcript_5011/g.7431 Transcript_5011/m.7431 type:complete len:640 (-) Transcript_5011:34-1953(-)
MIRCQAPKFVYPSDELILPVVFENAHLEDIKIECACQVNENCKIDNKSTAGYEIDIPEGGRYLLNLPLSIHKIQSNLKSILKGEENVVVKVVGKSTSFNFADALTISIPIKFPTSVIIEENAEFELTDQSTSYDFSLNEKPSNEEKLGLSLSLSTSKRAVLTKSLSSLNQYPYGCTEQVSSILISMICAYTYYPLSLKKKKHYKKKINSLIKSLIKRRNASGAFGFWHNDFSPFCSVYGNYALLVAHKNDFSIDSREINRSIFFFKTLKTYMLRKNAVPIEQFPDFLKIITFMGQYYYINNFAEANEINNLQQLIVEDYTKCGKLKLPLEALVYIYGSLTSPDYDTIKDELKNYIFSLITHENETTCYLIASISHSKYHFHLHSSSVLTAALMESIMQVDINNQYLSKLSNGLLFSLRKDGSGAWPDTFSNAKAFEILTKYFLKTESMIPEYSLSISIDDYETGAIMNSLETLINHHQSIKGNEIVHIKKSKGNGVCYLNMFLQRYPLSIPSTMAELKSPYFEIRREFSESLSNLPTNCTITIHLRITVLIDSHHVVIEDAIPSGWEIIKNKSSYFSHTEYRSTGLQVFANSLTSGVYKLKYECRSVYAGNFVVPPAQVFSMYESFKKAHTPSTTCIIE